MNNVVSFSGGKDSTAMALLMLEKGVPIHSVVAFDTGWEFPQMYEHWDQFERYTGLKITVLRSNKPFTHWMLEREVIGRIGDNDELSCAAAALLVKSVRVGVSLGDLLYFP